MRLKSFSPEFIKGISFGLTSAIISSLGIIVGVETATSSTLAVVSAIVIMAVANGLSDAMGIHLSEEAENEHTSKEVWLSTLFTFLGVCVFTLTFVIPILFFSFPLYIWVSISWGVILLSLLSLYIAREQGKSSLKVIFEHNAIAGLVVIVSYYLGILLKMFVS